MCTWHKNTNLNKFKYKHNFIKNRFNVLFSITCDLMRMFFYLIKILHEKYTVLSRDKGYFLSVISCTFVLLLIGITDYPLFNLQISSIFWLISGSSLAALTRT